MADIRIHAMQSLGSAGPIVMDARLLYARPNGGQPTELALMFGSDTLIVTPVDAEAIDDLAAQLIVIAAQVRGGEITL